MVMNGENLFVVVGATGMGLSAIYSVELFRVGLAIMLYLMLEPIWKILITQYLSRSGKDPRTLDNVVYKRRLFVEFKDLSKMENGCLFFSFWTSCNIIFFLMQVCACSLVMFCSNGEMLTWRFWWCLGYIAVCIGFLGMPILREKFRRICKEADARAECFLRTHYETC